MNKTHAVILAAGQGKRLLPLTETTPKCLVEVNGSSILENALTALSAHGVQTATIVVGHLALVVRDRIGQVFRGMRIGFVDNADFATTNSMYSLHLGLQNVNDPTWVLEGDVFFEHRILNLPAPPDIAWFVDSAMRHLDGAYVEAEARSRACSLQIIRDLRLLRPNQSKSIGIIKLTQTGVHQMQKWLRDGIAMGQQNLYYDLIIGQHMTETAIHVVDVAGSKWFEIDTHEDLEKAGQLFA